MTRRDDETDTRATTDPTGADAPDPRADDAGFPLSRRAALGGAALLGSGVGGYLLLAGGPEGQADGRPDDPRGPSDHFSVWAEMQDVLKTSPDHLPGRAKALVDGRHTETDTTTASVPEPGGTDPRPQGGSAGPLETTLRTGTSGDRSAGGRVESHSNGVSETDERTRLEELFRFVRDEIQTTPTEVDGLGDVDSVVRWGVRGTLRCGMGTPRDKAELLAALYREAGFDSAVRVVDIDTDEYLTEDAVRAHLLEPPVREGEPTLEADQLTEWADRLGREPSDEEPPLFDEGGAESRQLGQDIRQVLPEDVSGRIRGPSGFDWRWNGSRGSTHPLPLVEVSDSHGNSYDANLFADVPFGESGSTEDPAEPPDVDRPDPVRVTLSAVTPDALDDPFELVSGEWEVEQLVGRQLRVRTVPTLELFDKPTAGVDEFDSFVPSLAVQGVDVDGEAVATLSEFGDLVTLQGDQYSTGTTIEAGEVDTDDEPILRNGRPIYDPANEPSVEAIESLDIDVRSADYPRVTVDVTALDGAGEHVTGLGADSFVLTDNDGLVAPTMQSLEPTPEIVFLIDVSASMNRGVSAATDDEAYDELQELLEETVPNAIIDRREVDSDMWRHLPEAIADDPDLIVYAHDGLPANSYDERVDSVLATAPTTVLLSARDETSPVEDEVVLRQAELTGATAVPMGEWEHLRDTLIETATTVSDESPTYKAIYGVPDREPGVRPVELAVGDEPTESPHLTATDTYETDGAESGVVRSIVGLYLTIEHRGEQATQTLGGYDPLVDESWNPYGDDPDSEVGFGRPGLTALAEDARLAMLGGVDVSIEGDGVPFSVQMDDMLEAGQTYRELDTTVRELRLDEDGELTADGLEKLREAWHSGRTDVEWDPFLVQSPLENAFGEDGLTYFLDPRIVSYQVKPVVDGNEATLEESLNVFVHTRAATAIDDAEDRFERTLERTARISVLESARFDETTFGLIGDTPIARLGDLPDDVSTGAYNSLWRGVGFSSRDLQVAPVDGEARAMWNVDSQTGSVIGLLADGTGGGKRQRHLTVRGGDVDRTAAAMNIYLNLLSSTNLIAGVGSVALGAVGAYYAELAKLYLKVTAVLGAISDDPRTTGMDDLAGMASGTAAGYAENAARDLLPGGNWVGRFWDMAVIAGVP